MYSIDRLLRQVHFRKKGLSGFRALEINYLINQLAMGMMGVFGVLFVFELGKDLLTGLKLVLVFFGLQRLVVGVVAPVIAKMIAKTGYRWMMLMGSLSLGTKAWLLMQVNRVDWSLLAGALLLGGIGTASYYQGYHGIFLDDNDDDKIGEQIGLMTMLGRLALVISPVLAGWLVEAYGFEVMFGTAMSLIIISLGPLFLMPHHDHRKQKFSLRHAVKLGVKRTSFSWSVAGWHIENAIQVFYWPVLLFLLLDSHLTFGLVGGLVMVVNSMAVYGAGKIYDKRPLRRGQLWMTGLVILSDIGRFFAPNIGVAVGADSMNRSVSPWWWMKIRRRALVAGEKLKTLEFAAIWEWSVTTGYLTGLVAGYGVLKLSGGDWRFLIIPAAVGAVMASWCARHSLFRN